MKRIVFAIIGPSGLHFAFVPKLVSVAGAGPRFGIMTVLSSAETDPRNYNVTILAVGSRGAANQSFVFDVQKNLILLSAINHRANPSFSNLTLNAGDIMTWMSLDGPTSDDDPDIAYHTISLSCVTQYELYIKSPAATSKLELHLCQAGKLSMERYREPNHQGTSSRNFRVIELGRIF